MAAQTTAERERVEDKPVVVVGQSTSERLVALETLQPNLATKTDIAEIRLEIEKLKTELKGDNASLRTDFENFRTKIESSFRIVYLLGTLILGILTLMTAIAGLILHALNSGAV